MSIFTRDQKITPCLWFDGRIEEAVDFYISVFGDGKILSVGYYGEAGPLPKGTIMTIVFTIQGQELMALNGGPLFKFSEAVSFMVHCDNQAEVDYYWSELTADGGSESQCGWLKDKFGLSWQIVPTAVIKLLSDKSKADRAMGAIMPMKKIDIAAVERACAA